MNFTQYQTLARETAIYPTPVIYPVIGLAGECGEVSEKIKKAIRDGNGNFGDEKFIEAVTKELGDVLWYVSNLASDLGISLEVVAATNITKLHSRKERGVLAGSGDNR